MDGRRTQSSRTHHRDRRTTAASPWRTAAAYHSAAPAVRRPRILPGPAGASPLKYPYEVMAEHRRNWPRGWLDSTRFGCRCWHLVRCDERTVAQGWPVGAHSLGGIRKSSGSSCFRAHRCGIVCRPPAAVVASAPESGATASALARTSYLQGVRAGVGEPGGICTPRQPLVDVRHAAEPRLACRLPGSHQPLARVQREARQPLAFCCALDCKECEQRR